MGILLYLFDFMDDISLLESEKVRKLGSVSIFWWLYSPSVSIDGKPKIVSLFEDMASSEYPYLMNFSLVSAVIPKYPMLSK